MSLTIRSSFGIAAPRAQAWAVLTDIERAAPCFPGASLTGRRDDGSWNGAFTVKLGPMSFKFAGSFGFVTLDEAQGLATVKADGTDVKGRGGANARVEMTVLPIGAASTRVELVSSVDLSGGVAQYGRGAGMIEALSQQLVDQFARNLSSTIAPSATPSNVAMEDLTHGVIDPAVEAPKVSEPPAPAVAQTSSRPTPHPHVPPAAAAPLDAGGLLWKTFVAALRRWFGLRPSR